MSPVGVVGSDELVVATGRDDRFDEAEHRLTDRKARAPALGPAGSPVKLLEGGVAVATARVRERPGRSALEAVECHVGLSAKRRGRDAYSRSKSWVICAASVGSSRTDASVSTASASDVKVARRASVSPSAAVAVATKRPGPASSEPPASAPAVTPARTRNCRRDQSRASGSASQSKRWGYAMRTGTIVSEPVRIGDDRRRLDSRIPLSRAPFRARSRLSPGADAL